MTQHPNPPSEAASACALLPAGQNQSKWFSLARRAWIGLAIVLMVYFVASVPVYYQMSLTVCTSADPRNCFNALVTTATAIALDRLHLSIAAYVGLIVALDVAASLLTVAIGVLIFWRLPHQWKGLYFSVVLVVAGATQLAMPIAASPVIASTPLLLQLLVAVSVVFNLLQSAAAAVFFLTFPTGRLTPHWSGVLLVLAVVIPVLPASVWTAAGGPLGLAFVLTYIAMVGVQLYRYFRVYDQVQRQQAKWCVFAVAAYIFANFVPPLLAFVVVGSLNPPDSWFPLLANLVSSATLVLLPLSVGIAILRYRLWDVDVLINRALVYASLTTLLAGIYVGLIVTLQALMRALTGSLTQQPLVLVASTLAIAALFQPLRRRLQSTIDGRFYRRKYDAAQVVAAFSSTLRHEVNLDELHERLLSVVEETMQPTRVALWLRPASPERIRATFS